MDPHLWIISRASLNFIPKRQAQEARNMDFTSYRRGFTWKTSRIATNEDLMGRMLITSDPYTIYVV